MERELDIVARLLNRGVVVLCGPRADTGPLVPRIVAKLRERHADMERASTMREITLDELPVEHTGEHVTLVVSGLDEAADLTVVDRQKRLDAFATLVEGLDPHAIAVIATLRPEREDALHGHARLDAILEHALFPVGVRNSGVVPRAPARRKTEDEPTRVATAPPRRGSSFAASALCVILAFGGAAAAWRAFDAEREAKSERASARAAKIVAREALASQALLLADRRDPGAPLAALRALAIDRELLGSADARVQLALDAAAQDPRVVLSDGAPITDARWLPGGALLIVSRPLLSIVDGKGRREIRPPQNAAFEDARVFGEAGIASGVRGEVFLFDARSGAIRQTLEGLADSGKDVKLAAHAPRAVACLHGRCTVIDEGGAKIPLGPANVDGIALASDAKGVAFRSPDGTWSLWSVEKRTELAARTGIGKTAHFTAEDAGFLVVGEEGLGLHTVRGGHLRTTLDADFSALSANGRRLRVKDRARPDLVHFHDARLGTRFGTVSAANKPHALSPDGKLDAIWGDGEEIVTLFDTMTGAPKMTLAGHTGAIVLVTWSGSSAFVATASDDRTIRLWDTSRGGALVAVRTTEQTPGDIQLSTDGTRLLETKLVGPVLVWWSLSPEDARKNACALARGHDLTPLETVCP